MLALSWMALPWGRRVLIYRLRTGRKTTLQGHTDDVSLLRFVCGGRVLVSADDDGRVRLWPKNDNGVFES